MTDDDATTFAQGLAELMTEGREIHVGLDSSYPGAGLEDKVKKWIERARKLAEDVRAESFSITGGFPAGLSVTVTLKLGSR